MYAQEHMEDFGEAPDHETPVDLALARQNLLKLGSYARYFPREAQFLRQCIADQLERAERRVRNGNGVRHAPAYLGEIVEARSTLARLA